MNERKGNMIFYLIGALAGILAFYAAFFFLWGQIKGWFITGH